LTRPDAIRALTLTAAEIYGVSDRTGSIAKGKIANLVVMKGEAFDDKTTVEYVFVDGMQFKPSKESQQAAPAAGRRPSMASADDEIDGDKL
jgi:imidazolonepropionase-like amidohydrolase